MAELNALTLKNDANLVAYWRLEGNSNDSKGTNNGTDTDITYSAANGKYGQGAGFNGSSSKISLGNILSLKPTQAITVSTWIKPTTYTNYQAIVTTDGENDWIRNRGYGLTHTTGTSVGFWINDFSNNSVFANIATGSWHHVVGTYDKQNVKLYVDGVLIGSDPYTADVAYSTEPVVIGNGSSTNLFGWNGSIDDVAIFSRALTAAEILQLYKEMAGGSPMFFSGGVSIG